MLLLLQVFGPPWSAESPNYVFELLEEQPPSTILTTLHATDGDSTISEYKIIDGDDSNEYFEINNITGMYFNIFLQFCQNQMQHSFQLKFHGAPLYPQCLIH